MDKLIYTAMSGAKHDMLRQDVLAHNLANVNTPGFRAQTVAFRAVPLQDSLGARVFAIETTPGADFSEGMAKTTGNALDIAINGPGWITVEAPGGEAYTRNGSLQISPEGVLQTRTGRAVLSDGGQVVVPPNSALSIERDGTISAVPDGSADRKNVVGLGRLKLVNPPAANLQRGDDGLFRLRGGRTADSDPNVSLAVGAIEGSNVNPVEALVGMIALARQFDMHMKMLQNAEGNSRQANQILNLA